jgi:hypothetical protein
MPGWPRSVASIGAADLYVHDLRHAGNQFAANSGTGLRDLMTRMGHDSEQAARSISKGALRAARYTRDVCLKQDCFRGSQVRSA